MATTMLSQQFEAIAKYSACDIADALLKLDVPGAGFLPDIVPLNTEDKIIAPATIVLFVQKNSGSFPLSTDSAEVDQTTGNVLPEASNIPNGCIYSDLVTPGTIVVLSQPKGTQTAIMGGIMATRMSKIGAKGVLVDGRVRDVKYLKKELNFPIWCKSTSIVATKGQCKAHAINVPIQIGNTWVKKNDLIMLDPSENGAVCIPEDKLDDVLKILPKMVEEDAVILDDVLKGEKVQRMII